MPGASDSAWFLALVVVHGTGSSHYPPPPRRTRTTAPFVFAARERPRWVVAMATAPPRRQATDTRSGKNDGTRSRPHTSVTRAVNGTSGIVDFDHLGDGFLLLGDD